MVSFPVNGGVGVARDDALSDCIIVAIGGATQVVGYFIDHDLGLIIEDEIGVVVEGQF